MDYIRVDFPREFTTGSLSNSFGVYGKGEIGVDSSTIVIRAKKHRPFWFSTSVELGFGTVQVANVQRDGKSVRFEVLAGAGVQKPGFVTMRAADETTAGKIAQLLPATKTAEFEQQQRGLSEYMERLVRATPRTFVTPSLVAINVIVFAAMVASGVGLINPDGRMVVPWGSNFGPLTTDGQWWRLFTSMFLHFGIVHLVLNMWVLYDVGRVVERLYGNAHFALLYVVAGLAGSIASLFWNPMVNSAGASGAIFGVFGGLLAFMVDRRNQVPASIMKPQLISALVFILYSLGYGMKHDGIDNAAHVGGLAGGFIAGWLLTRPLDAEARSATGFRRLALILVVAPVVLVLATLPIKNTGETYRQEQQYLVEVKWFDEEVKRIAAEFDQLRKLVTSGSHSPDDLADRLERDVVVPWQAIHDRLSKNPLNERSRLRAHQALLLESVISRRDGFRLLAEATRTNDLKKLEQAKTRFAASTEAIEKLKQLASKR